MPFKHHADHRHQFSRAKYRVTNWQAYEAGLRQPGGIAGFPRRAESEYDAFGAGHSSTSISAAAPNAAA